MHETSRGPALFGGGVASILAALAALAAALQGDQQFTRALAHCSTTAAMPGYALAAGVVAVLLMACAALLGLLARRQRPEPDADPWWRVLGAPLAVLGTAGLLFAVYFGVVSVLLDLGNKQSCFG